LSRIAEAAHDILSLAGDVERSEARITQTWGLGHGYARAAFFAFSYFSMVL
jgi:hypothetical protein